MKKIFTTLFLLTAFLINAQTRSASKTYGLLEPINIGSSDAIKIERMNFSKSVDDIFPLECPGIFDTISYADYYNPIEAVNFGIKSQDYLVQYYAAPTEIKIEGIGFLPNVWRGVFGNGNPKLEIKIVKVTLTEDQLQTFEEPMRLGYYPADGNLPKPISPFLDNPETTGEWINASAYDLPEPFGEDLLSDDGTGLEVIPIDDEINFISTALLGEPIIQKGEIFAVVIKNSVPFNEENYDSSSIGLYGASGATAIGMKFYANGRFSDDDYGWWARPEYAFYFLVAVEYLGDLPPLIDMEEHTLSVLPGDDALFSAEVLDCNPTGGEIGISEVWFKYMLPGSNLYDSLQMNLDDDLYCVTVPNTEFTEPGDFYYHVTATDVNGTRSLSQEYTSFYFVPSSENLLILIDYENSTGYPQAYYFGRDDFENETVAEWDHDIWWQDHLPSEVAANYKNIVEIMLHDHVYINQEIIRNWIEEDGEHNYMFASQDFLGSYTWFDPPFYPGLFVYDIFGIYDINTDYWWYENETTHLSAVDGSLLGNSLYDKQMNVFGADTLIYDPYDIIGENNWIMGAAFLDDVDIFMNIEQEDTLIAVGGSRILDNGNKIAFLGYDPLSITSAPEPYWFGFSASAPQVEALRWFGIDVVTTTKIETEEIVNQFSLSQNYPNPFNPTTTIEYIIPNSVGDENFRPLRMVKLKVFDVLGREIKTLINKPMQPGKYKIEFDASKLSSGVYFYTLSSGEFIQTKKFLLLK